MVDEDRWKPNCNTTKTPSEASPRSDRHSTLSCKQELERVKKQVNETHNDHSIDSWLM